MGGAEAELIFRAPLAPLCAPALAARLAEPADILRAPLLRSYRPQDWPAWFKASGLEAVNVRGPLFDSSLVMVQAAMRSEGVALAPPALYRRELQSGELVRPFAVEADVGGYFLSRLKSRQPTAGMAAFRAWLMDAFARESPEPLTLPPDAV